ncbi:hypothetical protein OG985_43615 [Streptomyces sp. NBC_00289]|uniref:hypothetical protein n=1 Tax=Streptomyces sp. NBC_00289 TaxID=2975703 RepID=UPI0032516596
MEPVLTQRRDSPQAVRHASQGVVDELGKAVTLEAFDVVNAQAVDRLARKPST